ncbi:MAG: DUF2249 domain-containing protein [Brumimicrobium sp.]
MVINSKTKIAKIIKENPDAIQAIVKLSPDFKRLLNPVLRRLVAGRTSISMAAKMGKVTVEDFFNALEPLGFEIDREKTDEETEIENKPLPQFLASRSTAQIIEFDVRQMIADGGDPLKQIQLKVRKLNAGEALLIITDFDPVPLVKLLGNQGFECHQEFVDADTIKTYFYNPQQKEGEQQAIQVEGNISSSDDFDTIVKSFEGKMQEIDVRHLEMPGPMMTILETLEDLPDDKALYVNHKKVPVFLLSELKDSGYDYRIKEVQEGETYLIIFKI